MTLFLHLFQAINHDDGIKKVTDYFVYGIELYSKIFFDFPVKS